MKLLEKLKGKGKFSPLLMILYGLIIAAAGYIITVSRAAPPPPTLYLTPTSQTFPANTTFTVDVRENSGTTGINGVQANLSYPATLLDFVSIDTTGTPFSIVAQTSGSGGSIVMALGASAGGGNITGDQFVGKITFRTKTATGSAAVNFANGTALISGTTNTDILGSLSATAGATFVVDTQAPTVSVTAPANGASISNATTPTISVTATDNTTVAKVEISVDGVIKSTQTTAGPNYTYAWSLTGITPGSTHTISAKATDTYNNAATSSTVTVTVVDITGPTVSLTAPAANATVSGTTVPVSATATDTAGVNRVEFYVGSTLIGTDTTSPYSVNWDTKNVPPGLSDGTRSLTAKAFDNITPTANSNVSAAVNVNVDNADRTAPSTPGSLTSSNVTKTAATLTWTASTDNVGVTGYEVQRTGSTATTVTGLTYTDSGLSPGQTYTYTVKAIDAAGNKSTAATTQFTTIPDVPGDVVGNDGHVTIADLNFLLTNWGTSNAACDINKIGVSNGIVDIYDLSVLLTNYGR